MEVYFEHFFFSFSTQRLTVIRKECAFCKWQYCGGFTAFCCWLVTARHLGAMTHGPVDIFQKHGDKYIVSTEAVPLLYGYLSFNVSFYFRIFNYCFKMNCGQERKGTGGGPLRICIIVKRNVWKAFKRWRKKKLLNFDFSIKKNKLKKESVIYVKRGKCKCEQKKIQDIYFFCKPQQNV